MSENEKQEPIIVAKKKGDHGGHHGGSWKVAYADFTTSMMAFFLVMWLVVQSDIVRENVAGYFRDPTGFKKGGSSSVLPKEGSSIIEMKHENSLTKDMTRKQREKEVRKQLQKAGAEIMKALKQAPEFSSLRNQIEIEMTAEGLRIQLLDSSGETFFERGHAELKPNTKLLLRFIANQLGRLPNSIIIEGHTDSYQYAANADYTNWELSVDRCNSARRWMKENGLRPDQISEIRGFADTEPKIRNNPADPRNRRIAIIVVNDFSGMNYLDKNVILKEDEIEEPGMSPSHRNQAAIGAADSTRIASESTD